MEEKFLHSKALSPNPKDLLGMKKVSITKVPATALAHCAHAMMNGADKYGAYNWRDKAVYASIYVDACFRHLTAWFEGEEIATDSKVHHLGHAMACLAIILDAKETGNLIDDRPVNDQSRGAYTKVLAGMNEKFTANKDLKEQIMEEWADSEACQKLADK